MKKAISFLLTLCLIPACLISTRAVSVQSSESPALWATEAVDYMQPYQLIPDKLLSSYTSNIRRDEFAAVLISIYNEACQNYQTFDNQPNPFPDTLNNPYADDIKKASIMGIVNGTSKTAFSPQNFITREDVATIISRFIKLLYPEEKAGLHNTIADKNNISSYALAAVELCMSAKIMNGIGNNIFSPKGYLTRQEAMVIMYNLCQRYQIIENGRESAISTLSKVYSGLNETIADNYLYIRIQGYPFAFNGGTENTTDYTLLRTPLVSDQKNKGEILLNWDRIQAYTIGQNKIFFCDWNSAYSMDKNGENIKKIRDLSVLRESSDIAQMQVEGDWLFIGTANSILKLRTDGTCISYISKGLGGDFKSCGQYLYTATSIPQSLKNSIQINRTSLTGSASETLYEYERKDSMSYGFYPNGDSVYLALYDYDDIDNNNMLIKIDGNSKSSSFLKSLNNADLLTGYGEDVYITSVANTQISMINLTGGKDYHVSIPKTAKENLSLFYDKYMIILNIDNNQQFTRYYHIYNLETKTYSDIYGN
jgi:hypothetical protein